MKTRFSLTFGLVEEANYHMGAVTAEGITINMKLCNTLYRFITVFLHELIHWVLEVFYLPERLHYWNEIISTYLLSYNPPLSTNRKTVRKQWKAEYRYDT